MQSGKNLLVSCAIGLCVLLAGCATGKGVRDAADIRDDGKSNIALLTYDISVFVTDRHASEKDTTLAFRCPDGKSVLGGECFRVKLPYKGTSEVDGFGLYAFESSSAKAIKLKYGSYDVTSAQYRMITERVPETFCSYNKKTKREDCSTRMKDKTDSHSIAFAEPMAVSVVPGAGCYIGHLELSIVDDEVRSFSLDTDTPLSADKLDTMQADLSAAVLQQIDGPCS